MTTHLEIPRRVREQLPDPGDYKPFPSISYRNAMQESVEVPLLVRFLRLPERPRILEVGCGRGIALVPLAKLCRSSHLVGIDIDADAIEDARFRSVLHRVPADCFQADVRDIPLPNDTFDLVIDFGTCYHITHPEQALREIARVLRPGGLFVHETRLNQCLMHPVRSRGHALPWEAVPCLSQSRSAVLWATRTKSLTRHSRREDIQ